MATPWLLILPVAGIGWWALGFPPGWGWIINPFVSNMPVNVGELVSLARTSREIETSIGYLREACLADAKRAVARGEQVVDFEFVVPEDAPMQLERVARLLARACSRLARRHLLTLPASEDVVAFRLGWREEVLSQLAGRPPAPCPISPEGRTRERRG